MKSPLVKMRGQWVELNQEDLQHALTLLAHPQGEASGRELARMALGASAAPGGLPVTAVQASGELGAFIAVLEGSAPFAELPQPPGLARHAAPLPVPGDIPGWPFAPLGAGGVPGR